MGKRERLCAIVVAIMLLLAGVASAAVPTHARTASRLDLRTVDWTNQPVPAAACGGHGSIPISDSSGSLSPIPKRFSGDSFYGKHAVSVYTGPEVYGDLGGAAGDVAGLEVDCTNGGGTADGQLLFSWVIFSGANGHLSVVGIIMPRVQPRREHASLLKITVKPGAITAHEYVYGKFDATCCATGRATTIWNYRGGKLTPSAPVITKRPADHLP
jgi:hypothetical protein